MHRFDYSEILGDLPQDIVRMLSEISRIRAMERIRRKEYSKDYARMEEVAKLASIKYSNEIEGIITTDERIREIVLRGGAPLNHSEEEIAGYRDALNRIHTEHDDIGFDRRTIIGLHTLLRTKESDREAYKDRDNAIVSIGPDGRRYIVYEPVPASETEEHMEQLCIAYQELSTQGYDPLLYIPCVIVDYLCIHPFIDGNGRTSRLLTMLMLYREGIDICRYVSMDEHISMTKQAYYDALGDSSEGWRENRWTYIPFIRYFMRTLLECYIDLDTRFVLVDGKRIGRTETVEGILAKAIVPMSMAQIRAVIPDVSVYTIQKAVKRLMAEGKVERVGNTKSARYRYKGGIRNRRHSTVNAAEIVLSSAISSTRPILLGI